VVKVPKVEKREKRAAWVVSISLAIAILVTAVLTVCPTCLEASFKPNRQE